MPMELVIRVPSGASSLDVPATLVAADAAAARSFAAAAPSPSLAHALLTGDRDYHVTVALSAPADARAALARALGAYVRVTFAGRSPVRRVLRRLVPFAEVPAPAPATPPASPNGEVDLTDSVPARDALRVLTDGTFSTVAATPQRGLDASAALVRAARWVSTRRSTTFERLFAASAFHPDVSARPERLDATQARALVAQVRGALDASAVGSPHALAHPDEAAQLRSACVTVLSHVVATVLRDATFRAVADEAAALLFAVIASERGDTSREALRAHTILLLQLRGAALSPADRDRAQALVKTLTRAAPPYDDLPVDWNFAMCSAWDFHEGEVEVLAAQHGFRRIDAPADAPRSPSAGYVCLEAPFRTPKGGALRVYARSATPSDENTEMGDARFVGLLINRHAQLGSFDMRATQKTVEQRGYKLMMNSQCAGLTTRFALSRTFPDADLYSSWDSTYFRTGTGGRVNASEGLDCFVALLRGMAQRATHAQLDQRMRSAQWFHPQQEVDRAFSQFVGPAHPLVVARYSDVNHDARGDFYDGFLDFDLRAIATEMRDAIVPRDPGVRASQIGGDAARSLGWAAGSMNRVTQYSDLWAALPGRAELFYAFESAGYFSHLEAPADVPAGPLREDLGRLPAVCRYVADRNAQGGLRVEVMFHAWLAHAPEELKRLLVAADAMNRAFDLKHLAGTGALATPQARRAAVLLMMAGLLEFPADPTRLDGLWSTALTMLNLPAISRSAVRACITDEDHDASNYYGSVRGVRQLVGAGTDRGTLGASDPLAWTALASADPFVGRARPLDIP